MRLVGGLAVLVGAGLVAPASGPERPRILGISHVTFRVSDLARARSFYQDLLGYPTVSPDGRADTLLVLVSDRQHVELRSGLKPDEDRLDHVALQTDDVEAMRRLLLGRGVEVSGAPAPDPRGDRGFRTGDPEGRSIELVQHAPGARRAGPAPARPRVAPLSGRILHAGILVGDLAAANRFYGDLLGLIEIWRGSRSGTELSWTNMQVPDGGDYIEFMLYGELPAPSARGTTHHICLEVGDLEEAKRRLLERVQATSYTRPLEVRVGTNRKRQLNLFDPDGTRVELMEPRTVDGRPVPPSTAPPPRRP